MRLLLLLAMPALLALAACSEVGLAIHLAKKVGNGVQGEMQQPSPARAVPSGYKLGLPYEIGSAWYYPSYDPYYDRTGVASWYGPAFHGQSTANGERFDMNEVSAAHPTLPLPSRVRVTNLKNGRQLIVRVNDRGPFSGGRLIDLSRRAAQLLGFYNNGLAKVRVQYLGLDRLRPDAPRPAGRPILLAAKGTPSIALKPGRPEPPARAEATGSSPAGPEQIPPTPTGAEAVDGTSKALLVEAALLEGRDAADRLGERVGRLGAVAVEAERRGDRVVYAVRIGPVDSDAEAASILAKLTRAGLENPQIIAAGYR